MSARNKFPQRDRSKPLPNSAEAPSDKRENPRSKTRPLPPVVIRSRWTVLALVGLTWLLTLPLFAPISAWPVAYVAFVPWIIALTCCHRPVWAYFVSYLLGAGFFLYHLSWLANATWEGHMAACLLWLGPQFLLGAWLVRLLWLRLRLTLIFAFPLGLLAVELLRSRTPLAFPWFLLGHSQIRLLPMVQLADLVGVMGISFVIALVNGWLAQWILTRMQRRQLQAPSSTTSWAPSDLIRVSPVATIVMIATLAATNLYGWYRLSQSRGELGPRVAVVQGDFILSPDFTKNAEDQEKREFYLSQVGLAAEEEPDLIVLPETPWWMTLNPEVRQAARDPELLSKMSKKRQDRLRALAWYSKKAHERWLELTQTHDTTIVVGGLSEEPQPDAVYPQEHRYNSAFLYSQGEIDPVRYDKIHLVPFGEYIPLRYSKHFHWVYRFVNDGPWNPFGGPEYEHSLTAGEVFTVFELEPSATDASLSRFAVTICYEDVIPQHFRHYVVDETGEKRVDFMLNISNDGWFGHGHQQAQHLVNCAFRAIENRVGVARAVNTGISGFLDSTGQWRNIVTGEEGTLRAGGSGFRADRVVIDPRVTLYSRVGDLFAWLASFVALILVVRAWSVQRRARTAASDQTDSPSST